jgi:hypothetical protein
VTETHATAGPLAPIFPPGRYGRRRESRHPRSWVAALLVVALAVVLGLIVVRLYRQYGDPTYNAQVITYTDITDSQVVVKFEVQVPPGGSAICVLRARSRDGAEVGREEVRVTATQGQMNPVLSHRLATTARPLLGEVLSCRAAG